MPTDHVETVHGRTLTTWKASRTGMEFFCLHNTSIRAHVQNTRLTIVHQSLFGVPVFALDSL